MPTECICCERPGLQAHLRGLLRCPRCGHVRADLELSSEELRKLYSAEYFKGAEYRDYERERPALRRNFRRALRDLTAAHPPGARLWEVGAAYGYFLHEAAGHFQVAGCDISEAAARAARERLGLDVHCMDYLGKEPGDPYDVVCLWDTVEHLAEPGRFLAKAAAELRPGGTLALTTGDIGSLHAWLRGPRWRLIHPPTHLHYFTAKSIRRLLERLGFDHIRIRHRSFWRSADAAAYALLCRTDSPRCRRLYKHLDRLGVLRFSFPLNLYDLMTVYARRVP